MLSACARKYCGLPQVCFSVQALGESSAVTQPGVQVLSRCSGLVSNPCRTAKSITSNPVGLLRQMPLVFSGIGRRFSPFQYHQGYQYFSEKDGSGACRRALDRFNILSEEIAKNQARNQDDTGTRQIFACDHG